MLKKSLASLSFKSPIYSSLFAEIKEFKFIEKYLVYAPMLLYERNLKEEDNDLYSNMIELDSLRNNIVHEGSSKEHKKIKNKSYSEMYEYFDDIIDDVEDVINWVYSLVE